MRPIPALPVTSVRTFQAVSIANALIHLNATWTNQAARILRA